MSDAPGPRHATYDAVEPSVRLALQGRCDGRAAAGHRAHVRDLLQDGPSALVVDLGRPRRLSSETVGLLLWLHRTCLERGVHVVVTRPPRRGVDPLWASGLLASGPAPLPPRGVPA
jgi:anti-anti-sigma regulatory factor